MSSGMEEWLQTTVAVSSHVYIPVGSRRHAAVLSIVSVSPRDLSYLCVYARNENVRSVASESGIRYPIWGASPIYAGSSLDPGAKEMMETSAHVANPS